jgi:hypothetical protein
MAILTHRIGTVKTDTAVGTVFVHTVSTFAAVNTSSYGFVADIYYLGFYTVFIKFIGYCTKGCVSTHFSSGASVYH